MKRIAAIALLLLITIGAAAQELTKKELRQQRRAEREKIYEEAGAELNDEDNKPVYEDGIYKQRVPKDRIKDETKGATILIATTGFETPKEVFDVLMRALIQNGDIPKETDKEYFLIKTEQKQVGTACYDIKYAVYEKNGKVNVRANATAYKSFSVGMSFGGFRSNTNMVIPVKNEGVEGSLTYTAWKEIEHYILALPLLESLEYIIEE